ncbi:MAG: hypothetical protein U1C71_01500, partial [archaeon]|nr:hypothetical protein [archaeon]
MIYGPINLSGYSNTVFEFWLKGNVEPGYDFLSVNLSADGTSWVTIDTIDNTYSDWQKKSYPFTSTSGRIYLNLVMETDNSIHSYTGYYVDDVKVFGESLLPDGALCSNSSQCQSGVCGGARTDYYIHCNQDQSPTAYGDEIIYANTCGGAGTYSHTNYDGVSQACSAGKVCDADLAYTSSSFTTSLICKNNLYNACTTNPDCWNDNGGVDCKGTSGNKICTYGTDGSYCTENAQCNSNTCINNQCSTGLPNGSLCALDSQCQSRYCVYDTPTQSHCMAPASYSPFILNYDTWDAATSNGTSTNLDQVAFTSTKVRPVTYNLRESTDMLCYDYNNDGVFDACYYDPLGCGGSGCASTSCNSFSIPNSVSAGKKYSCILDDYFGCLTGVDVPDQICTGAGCVVDTAFPSHREARVKAYYDCDNSDGLRAEHTILNSPPNEPRDDYWVVNPKFNYCESQTQPEREYWVLGAFGPNYSDIKTVNGPISCQSGTSCSILADEQYISTPGGSIPSACKTNPGGSCTQNSNCLYNACQGNICQDGFIYEAFLIDELSNPLSNYTINLTTCSDSLVTSAVTDADGKFVFAAGASNYKMKLVVPWGEMLFDTGPNDCSPFGTGFLGGNIWQFHETTVVQGKAITPQGNPSPGLPFDLGACTDNTLITNTTSNSFGDFLLQSPSDRYRLNVTLNDARISLTDTQNNACFLFYGELDLGEMELVNDCSLYNNSCYLGDYRLNSCSFDPENGCTCSIQYCEAGCSEGAPQCNLVGTGTIHAIVMDSNSPIRNAPIYLNNSLSGKTDGKGKHDINKKHGSYTLTAACPDGSSPTTKPIFLGGNHAYGYFDLDNCPVQEKGDLLIRAENVNGYPVANVVVEIDGDEIGYTNGFGQLYIKDLDFGSREVRAIYKITNEVGTGAYQIYSLADVNQSEVVLTLSILKPSDPGFGGQAYTGNVLFIPAAVVIVAPFALAAIDAISVAWSTQDLCTCILDYDYTLNELGQCMADFVTPTCQDIRTCENGLTKWGDEINNGKCWAESIFLAGDVASPLIPVGLIGHAGLFLLNKVPDFKILDRLAEGSKVLQKGVDFIEYQLSNGKLIRGEIVDASAQTIKRGPAVGVKIANLTDEGILSAERVVQKHGPGGENALKSLINRTDGDFTITKEYMEDTFNGLGKIKQGGLPGIELAKVEKKLAHDVKGGNFGNIKGILGEIEVGAKPEFVSQLAEFQYRPPGAVSPVEWKLLNGDLVEVKTTNMLTTTYANYIEKIEDIGKKVNDWSTHAPSAKINIRFTKPINNEVKNDIMAEIVKAAPGININMI